MRKCRSISLIACLALTMGFVGLTSRLVFIQEEADEFDEENDPGGYQHGQEEIYVIQQSSLSSAKIDKQTQRYVTPSLAELGDRGILPEANKHVLMVTRVPGAGSELLILLLQRLQGFNAFKHIRLPPGDEGILSNLQQELLVEEITSIIRQEAIPLSFDGNVKFLNFSEFGRQSPTYISLVRDPLDPVTLDRFKSGHSSIFYKGSISHFCGHDTRCSERNNEWALKQAKANVIKWYPVVGVLDRMDQTLMRLEQNFPYFFEGASYIYEKLLPKKKNSYSNTSVKPVTSKHLKKLLKTELEFYDWIRSRLLNGTTENQ